MRVSAILPACLLLFGCASPERLRQDERDALLASLLDTDHRWAEAASGGDVDLISSFWTDDAVVHLSGRPSVRGREGLREMVRLGRETPGFSISWKTYDASIADSGELAHTLATYRIAAPAPGRGIVVQEGNSICVWRREDGAWRCSLEVHAAVPPSGAMAGALPAAAERTVMVEVVPGDAQLDASELAIRALILETIARVWGVHPVTDLRITVSAGTRVIPEVGLGAWSIGESRINVTLDTTSEPWLENAREKLPLALAHEMAHTIRLRAFMGSFDPMGPEPTPDQAADFASWMRGRPPTLGEFVINEGLADWFAMEVHPGGVLPWDSALPADQLERWTGYVLEHWEDREYDRAAWVMGSDEIPRWASYSVGFRLVSRYLERHPGVRPSDLLAQPGNVFRD